MKKLWHFCNYTGLQSCNRSRCADYIYTVTGTDSRIYVIRLECFWCYDGFFKLDQTFNFPKSTLWFHLCRRSSSQKVHTLFHLNCFFCPPPENRRIQTGFCSMWYVTWENVFFYYINMYINFLLYNQMHLCTYDLFL